MLALSVALVQAEMPPLAKGTVDAETLQEIQRQRAQFESPLAGSSFDAGDEAGDATSDAFAEAYRRVAAEREATPFATPALPEVMPLDPGAPTPRVRFVNALRDAARLLDTAAADLEEVESYAEADALRARAKTLRRQARQPLVESPSANLEK
jgi:hypothetical protein